MVQAISYQAILSDLDIVWDMNNLVYFCAFTYYRVFQASSLYARLGPDIHIIANNYPSRMRKFF